MHFTIADSMIRRARHVPAEVLRAVDGVDLQIMAGEALGLVGESGCGKSTLGRCIVGLHAPTAGEIRYAGEPLAEKRKRSERRRIQMVFQDPYSSLNPRMTVRQTLSELLRVHNMTPRSGIDARCRELLAHRRPAGQGSRLASAQLLGRPAPARVDRPRARARAGAPGGRRAGVGARRVGAGDRPQPARRSPPRAWAHDALHRPQHGGRPPCVRPGRGDVPGPDRRDVARPRSSSRTPGTPTRRAS